MSELEERLKRAWDENDDQYDSRYTPAFVVVAGRVVRYVYVEDKP